MSPIVHHVLFLNGAQRAMLMDLTVLIWVDLELITFQSFIWSYPFELSIYCYIIYSNLIFRQLDYLINKVDKLLSSLLYVGKADNVCLTITIESLFVNTVVNEL